LTIEHETPSCVGCSLQCGIRQKRLLLIETPADLASKDLMTVVTKVYGAPLMVLLTVLLLESVVVSVGSIWLLFILLSILPASIFLMARWAREDILRKMQS